MSWHAYGSRDYLLQLSELDQLLETRVVNVLPEADRPSTNNSWFILIGQFSLKRLVLLDDWILDYISSADKNANRKRAIFLPKFKSIFVNKVWPLVTHLFDICCPWWNSINELTCWTIQNCNFQFWVDWNTTWSVFIRRNF